MDDNRWKQLPDDYLPYKDTNFQYTFDTETFEDFWQECEEFAAHNHISTEYVEDEFILDGELKYVYLIFEGDEYKGADER